jgi:uncharacterized protein YlzI (FlbEa/FlbD family)
MLIFLTQMDTDARGLYPVAVNTDEIVTVSAYGYHSFRPPCGSKITFRSGNNLLVSESVEQVMAKVGLPPTLEAGL